MKNKGYQDPHTYIGFLVWTLTNIMSNAMTDTYKTPEKLCFSHLMVLSSLYWKMNENKNTNQKDLANFMYMKEVTTSVILRKLYSMKLVDFLVDKKDKRAKLVKLTSRGEELIEGFLDLATSFEGKISSGSPQLLTGLKALIQELSYRHR